MMYESGVGPARASGLGCVSQPRGPWSGRWGTDVERVLALLPRQASSSVIGPRGKNDFASFTSLSFFFRNKTKYEYEKKKAREVPETPA